MFRTIQRLRKFQHLLLDIFTYQIGFIITSYFYKNHLLWEIPSSLKGYFFEVIFTISSVFLFILLKVYSDDLVYGLKRKLKGYVKMFIAISSAIIISEALLMFVNEGKGIDYLILGGYFIVIYCLIVIQRLIFCWLIALNNKSRQSVKNVLIIGSCDASVNYYNYAKEREYLKLNVVGCVKANECECTLPVECFGDIDELVQILIVNVVDEVCISQLQLNEDEIEKVFTVCKDMGITITMLINTHNKLSQDMKIIFFSDIPALKYTVASLNSGQLFIKRCVDVFGSFIGLIFLGLSLLIVAPLIKLGSKGPVFFKQIRIGKNGRRFKILKFRTMYENAEQRKNELKSKNEMNGQIFKISDDPRITKVGKYLRKTSIDEIPQFWNVFMSHMSLVGTRPPTADEVKEYEVRHFKRLSVMPGITGNWQISGRNTISDFEEIVALDTKYIENWTIWEDFRIILKTIQVVLIGRGAK